MTDSEKQSNIKTIKAASWYTVSNFISKCMLYLFTPLYTRVLSEVEYGLYNNYLSWQSILVALFAWDMASTVAIAYVDYKEPKVFHRYVSTVTFLSLSIPAVFGAVMLVFYQQFSALLGVAPIYLILMVVNICTTSALQIFQAEQRSKVEYKLSSALTLGNSCGNMILTLLFVWLLPDKLFAVVLGGLSVTTVVNVAICVYVFSRGFCVKKEYVRYALRLALPLVPHVVSASLLSSANKILITKLCGSADTAFYSVINTCAMVVTLFVTSINSACVPWFYSRMESKDYPAIRKVTKVTIPLISLVALAVCLVGPEVVLIVGGKNYADAVYMMPPMIFGCVIRYVYTLYVNIEFYNKKTGGISVATAITAVVNVLLNFVFIQLFDYRVAAYTTLLSEVLLLTIHMFIVKRQGMLDVFQNKQNVGVLAVAGLICMSTMPLYSNAILRYTAIGIIGVAAAALLIKYRKEIIKLAKAFLRR